MATTTKKKTLVPLSAKRKGEASTSVKVALSQVQSRKDDPDTLPVADVIPNDWNPNVMTDAMKKKVATGLMKLLDVTGKVPPIVVRPHPTRTGKWQIIDGFHRWDIYRERGLEKIDAVVLHVDDATAIELTAAINYNRGEPEPDQYALYLKRYLETSGKTLEEAAEVLPETADEMQQILDSYEINVDHLHVEDDLDEGSDKKSSDAEQWVEIKFLMPHSQAEVVEAELSRLGSQLKGKNVRARALEYMAVSSSQTPLESIFGTGGDSAAEDEDVEEKVIDTKEKLKRRSARE